MLTGLSTINVELTSRCNKTCWMCGRRKIERDYPALAMRYGDMDFGLLKTIAEQLSDGIVVQLHNNGEPLLYPSFGEAVGLFDRQITNIVTNGKLLVEKAHEIIDKLDTLAVSIIEKDPEADEQYDTITTFLEMKGNHRPLITFRCLGDVNIERYQRHGLVATRTLHSPMGSFDYRRKPTVPEIGLCLDFLHYPAISQEGEFSICVRFDPERRGVLGNVKHKSLEQIWTGSKRTAWLRQHLCGQRQLVPLCSRCEFWGVPTGS